VATLLDPAAGSVSLTPKMTTVGALRRLPAPQSPGEARVKGVETTTFRVDARLVKMRLAADGDILLVVVDPATHGTMVVRFPAISCASAVSAEHRTLMRSARAALVAACGRPDRGSYTRVGGPATITGVGFFGPRNVADGAPNGIELQPVLGFHMEGDCLLGG
jgi:hypothetical protein